MKHTIWAITIALAAACTGAWAAYPDKPIRIIVPWPSGGAGDTAARIVADGLSQRLGQAVVVDNKPGANGIIGTQAALNAAPDGYTLYMGNGDTNVLNPQTYRKLPYDASRPFEPVAFIGRVPGVLVSRTGLGAGTGEELIRIAKARPGSITFASWASEAPFTLRY